MKIDLKNDNGAIMNKIKLVLMVFLLFFYGSAVATESITYDMTQLEKKIETAYQELNKETGSRNLSTFITNFSSIQDKLLSLRSLAQEQFDGNNKKIQTLGDAPTDGQTEPDQLAYQRKMLNEELDAVKVILARIDLALAKIDELNTQIVRRRNEALVSMLTYRQQPLWDVKNFGSSVVGFLSFLYEIITSPANWYHTLDDEKRQLVKKNGVNAFFLICFGFTIAFFLSLLIRRYFGYRRMEQIPIYAQKVTTAVLMFVARALIPSVVLGACLFLLYQQQNFFSGSFGISLRVTLIYILYFLICGVGISVLFVPTHPKWRLIEVSDRTAQRLSFSLLIGVFLIGIFSYFQTLALLLDQSADVLYALRVLSNAVKAGCISFILAQLILWDKDDLKSVTIRSKISILLIIACAVVFSFTIFGYIRLSEFILDRFIFSTLVFGAFYIIRNFLTALIHYVATRLFWQQKLNISEGLIGQIEFWAGLIVFPLLLIFFGLILLAVWGISVDVLLQNTKRILTGFNIGGMHVSITSIILGIITFFFCLAVIRMFKASLLNGRLQKISSDANIRSSLAAGAGFFGIVVSVLLSIVVMGGSLQGVALIAGGLSIGAGLGLQNVINNFVSGLILLFERPIKIGDIVNINGYEGTVRQINMRSTQLELWNRSNVIIPNADILSQSVVNMTYRNRIARTDILVDVDLESDVKQVEQILLEIAKNVDGVAKAPEPFVIFSDMTEGRLRFQISCYTVDISNRIAISNKIRSGILERFKTKGIAFFVPQRIVSVQRKEEEKELL